MGWGGGDVTDDTHLLQSHVETQKQNMLLTEYNNGIYCLFTKTKFLKIDLYPRFLVDHMLHITFPFENALFLHFSVFIFETSILNNYFHLALLILIFNLENKIMLLLRSNAFVQSCVLINILYKEYL